MYHSEVADLLIKIKSAIREMANGFFAEIFSEQNKHN